MTVENKNKTSGWQLIKIIKMSYKYMKQGFKCADVPAKPNKTATESLNNIEMEKTTAIADKYCMNGILVT